MPPERCPHGVIESSSVSWPRGLERLPVVRTVLCELCADAEHARGVRAILAAAEHVALTGRLPLDP